MTKTTKKGGDAPLIRDSHQADRAEAHADDATQENEVLAEARRMRDLAQRAKDGDKGEGGWKKAAGIGIGVGIGSAALLAALLYAGRKKD